MLRHLDIDFRWVEPRYVGPPLEIEGKLNRKRNIWGVEYEHVKAEAGSYWGAVNEPLKDVTAPAALDDYPWPQLGWFDIFEERTIAPTKMLFAGQAKTAAKRGRISR